MYSGTSWSTLAGGLIPESMGAISLQILGSNGGNMNTIAMIIQTSIVGIWAAILVLHARRLMRLTQVIASAAPSERVLRYRLRRVWWWLGREEFWSAVKYDSLRCLQLTLMLVLLVWGMS